VPKAMDGQARTELFAPEYVERHPVRYADVDIHTDGKVGQVMAETEEAKVEGRLRDLGYL